MAEICPECGCDLVVYSECPEKNVFMDGDLIRCMECIWFSHIQADEDGASIAPVF